MEKASNQNEISLNSATSKLRNVANVKKCVNLLEESYSKSNICSYFSPPMLCYKLNFTVLMLNDKKIYDSLILFKRAFLRFKKIFS